MKKINQFILIAFMSVIGISAASAQCAGSFIAVDNGSGNYTFTSNGTGGVIFVWSIDGNSYTGTSINQTLKNGPYNVCLYITDTLNGCFDTYCDSVLVTSGSNPASFNIVSGISYTDNGAGNYSFTSTTTGNPNYEVWSYGDGSSDVGSNVNHTFAANGTYTISLYFSDSLIGSACNDYATVTITVSGVISPLACQAGFVYYTDSLTSNVSVINSPTGAN